jgi:predicted Zn-dependent protease
VYRLGGSEGVPEALAAFAKARELIPDLVVTKYFEAQIFLGEGKLDSAEVALRQILLEQPDHKEASRDLRGLLERKEKGAKSGSLLGKFLSRK